jgi:hypothetical protein
VASANYFHGVASQLPELGARTTRARANGDGVQRGGRQQAERNRIGIRLQFTLHVRGADARLKALVERISLSGRQ